MHCDEIDDEASRGLETLATRALEMGLKDRVTASHTTAMHSYDNAYFIRLLRLLKMRGINVSVGQDDIVGARNPLGTGNRRDVQ